MPPTFRPSTSYAPLMPIQFAPPGPATPPRPTSQSSPTVPPVPSTWLVPQTTERDSSGAPEPSSCRRPHLMYAHGSGPTRCGAMRSSKRDAQFARMPPADSLEPNARWQAKLQITPANVPCARSLLRFRPRSWSRSCAKRSSHARDLPSSAYGAHAGRLRESCLLVIERPVICPMFRGGPPQEGSSSAHFTQ